MGGGFAVAYTRDQIPPPAAAYAEAMLERLPAGVKVLCEPGRSLVANAGVSLYTVGTVKDVPGVRRYVAVDGGMSDNIRPMLYDAVYEAEVADRVGDSTACRLVGMHCESGDVLIEEARLEEPRVGDVVVDPGDGRLRPRDGEQLQRRAAAAGRLLPRRRRPRRRAARDLRGPDRPVMSEPASASGCSAAARSAAPSPSCSRSAPARSRPPAAAGRRSPGC